jgi:hypothetical protein
VFGQQLDLYSGIAVPELGVDGDLIREQVVVRLPGPIGASYQATAAVDLASISNTGSDFLFATDAASIELDAETGDLLLHVDLAVDGDESYLHRFAYQVDVLSCPVEAVLEGSIEWDVSWGDPADPLPTFEIDVYGPPDPGSLGLGPMVGRGFSDPAVRATGIGGNPVWAASFSVTDTLPLNVSLTVIPALIGGFTPAAWAGREPVFTPGQAIVTFAYDQLVAFAGFEMTFAAPPPPPR